METTQRAAPSITHIYARNYRRTLRMTIGIATLLFAGVSTAYILRMIAQQQVSAQQQIEQYWPRLLTVRLMSDDESLQLILQELNAHAEGIRFAYGQTQPTSGFFRSSVPIVYSNTTYGYIQYDLPIMPLLARQVLWLGLLLLTFMFVIYVVHYRNARLLTKVLIQPLTALHQRLQDPQFIEHFQPLSCPSTACAEILRVDEALQGLCTNVVTYQQQQLEVERSTAMLCLATQVAHDLRSPLSSLQVAVRGLGEIAAAPASGGGELGQYVQVLQLSAKRLGDIANGLLAKQGGEAEQPAIFSVHAVLDGLIGEYQSRGDAEELSFVKQYHPHALEVYGERTRLQRAVGNIVKNAMEAMQGRGMLTVTTTLRDGSVILAIADTGPGMSPATLAKALQGGHTEGKRDGHGIGTQVVREVVESFGGRIEGASMVGQGTTFRLILPLPTDTQRETAERDALALKELVVPVLAGEPVLVVEDEPSMREQWRVLLTAQATAVRLCTCYEDVEAQQITSALTQTAIVDYHFANSVHTGLEVIRLLQDRGFVHLILCTAEYWKPSVQQQAQALGSQLCPKPVPERIVVRREGRKTAQTSSMPLAPLHEAPPIPCDCVLIDDDPLMHQVWQFSAKEVGKTVQIFARAEAFFAVAQQIHRHTPIYVDSNLGDGVKGEQVTQTIHAMGFDNIYLATGYQAGQFGPLPWVKGIIGKDPPWLASTISSTSG